MAEYQGNLLLPEYDAFCDSTAILSLPISGSELHGMMCGYLSAGAASQGEAYIQALMTNQADPIKRGAALILFDAYAVSQQQIAAMDFSFQLMLPDDHASLIERAQAFSEWCTGFTNGLSMSGIDLEELDEEEAHEAIAHLVEFAELDYESLQVNEEDEHALMEVSEYARMAVLRIHSELQQNGSSTTAH